MSSRPSAIDGISCDDNLSFMSRLEDACCDLIYIDPPFNADRTVRSSARAEWSFPDRQASGRKGHIESLRPRLGEMRRLLSRRGSIYVHLDWRTVHHSRILLDDIFGDGCFLNEIIWNYRTGSRPGRWFTRSHDTLLLYARSAGDHNFNELRGGSFRTRGLKRGPDGRPFKSTRNGPLYFHADGPRCSDVWDIPFLSTVSKERTGYPTQKPEALLDRVIRASSDEGDVVADFYCGSGTTLAVAKRLRRRWIGCDINPDAAALARRRLAGIGPSADNEDRGNEHGKSPAHGPGRV